MCKCPYDNIECCAKSCQQIVEEHGLTWPQYHEMEEQVRRTRLTDALFSWPQGPRRDILVHLVLTSR